MKTPTSVAALEELGRVRLSPSFFMRDFLFSEISQMHGIPNIPDDPDLAIAAGSRLCEEILEPLQTTFGRIAIRSGYRCAAVNDYGNFNRLNCASSMQNRARHIWDQRDGDGHMGAMACIVVPWFLDHASPHQDWRAMAWWIHDHLPYSSMCFFLKLNAFNIGWHEKPQRRIDSYAAPKGCLFAGEPEHDSIDRSPLYAGFPRLVTGAA